MQSPSPYFEIAPDYFQAFASAIEAIALLENPVLPQMPLHNT